jgi:hypothetical protein
MALVSTSIWGRITKHRKHTKQGTGRGTKYGTKPPSDGAPSRKRLQRYKKSPRGQGK